MMKIIDSHMHIWQLSANKYSWLTPELTVLYRDYPIEQAQAELSSNGISQAILVQAADNSAETQYLLSIAHQYAQHIVGVIGWLNFDSNSVLAELHYLAKDKKLCGIRPMLQDIEQHDWILKAAYQATLEKMAELNLVFDALIHPEHLPIIAQLATLHPRLTIVINHCAKPNLTIDDLSNWQQAIQLLAVHKNIYVKFSGLSTECNDELDQEASRVCLQWLLAHFSSQRILWGSDWPVVNINSSYQQWLDFSVTSLIELGLTPAQQQDVLSGNTALVYQREHRRKAVIRGK